MQGLLFSQLILFEIIYFVVVKLFFLITEGKLVRRGEIRDGGFEKF